MNAAKPNALKTFASGDAFPGVLLMIAAALSFLWANIPALLPAYEALKAVPLHLPTLQKPLEWWVNDLLMAIFFLYVGLELKRETIKGELSNPRGAALSIFAALGGMAVPAALYALLNAGNPDGFRGWGVPMATDIAFAVGVLSLLGKRVPLTLKLFLTALAVVDDLGAILVIAVFYTSQLEVTMLLVALGVYAGLWALNAAQVKILTPYLLLGVVLWYFVYKSGLHATIAGVLLATTIPMGHAQDAHHETPLEGLEHAIQPWVAFFVMPVFALFNAGVPLGAALGGGVSLVSMGAFIGLVFGKPLGVFGFSWIAVRLNLAELPGGASWPMIFGVGLLAGIGFTMALFIAGLAFAGHASLEEAKLGVIAGSVLAALLGSAWLRFATTASKNNLEP